MNLKKLQVPARPLPLAGTRHPWLILAAVWLGTLLLISPVLLHFTARAPRVSRTRIALALEYPLGIALCYGLYRAEKRDLGSSRALYLVLVIASLTLVVNRVHLHFVDEGNVWPPGGRWASNEVWQESLQRDITSLSPQAVPHSYRFLPNSIVLWIQMARVRFDLARDIYRLLIGLLLLYCIYRYARLFTSFLGAVIAMMLVAIEFPVSFESYAGQLTDPLSHLSFVLAFLFIQTANFPFLLTTLLIGSLAKETVLAMAGFYLIFCRKDRNFAVKGFVLCASSVAMYIAVRMAVLHEAMQYKSISNVPLEQVRTNWHDSNWPGHFFVTVILYTILAAPAWSKAPSALKHLVVFLFPVLFVSSLFFSWLNETRNFMPLVIVLAVIVAAHLTRIQARNDSFDFGQAIEGGTMDVSAP
jgi:hypothetical protein